MNASLLPFGPLPATSEPAGSLRRMDMCLMETDAQLVLVSRSDLSAILNWFEAGGSQVEEARA